jgi:class 3 adenylate cyclase
LAKNISNLRKINARRVILLIILVIFTLSVTEVLTQVGWLDPFEYTFHDLWHCLSGYRVEPRHTVIVAIDDQAFLEHPDEPLVFWGPYFADVIGNVRRAGARIIGLDYLFSVSAESWLKKLEVSGSDKGRIYDIPMRKELASGQVVLIANTVSNDKGQSQLLLPINDYLFALPGGPADIGLGNFYADQDGVVRRFLPTLFDDGTMPSLMFATLLSVRAAGLKPTSSSWSLGGREIPNSILPQAIGFVGPPGTIPRLSFSQLLNSQANEGHEIESLKDKVVIVAAEYLGNQDIHLTPYAHGFLGLESRMMSGAELHANIIETLLTGRFPRSVPGWLRLLYSAIVLTIGIALFFRLKPWWGLGVGLGLILTSTVLAFLFFQINLVLPVASLYFGMSVGYLGVLGFRLTGEERQRIRLRQMFGRYVSDEVVEKLLAIGHRPDQQGESLQVTVLFSDIRNFTTISERLNPHEVVEMLNAYFSRVCEPILEGGGTVDKFIGDAVMAVFGSPVPYEDHAQRALRAALAMSELAREFRFWMNEHFAHVDLPRFEIGIGLHTGDAVIGSIGSPKRMEFTAIGDTVNTASRLEGLTKELGWTIVASSDTIHAASSTVSTGKREKVSVKGREGHIEVFEVIGLKPEKGGIQ